MQSVASQRSEGERRTVGAKGLLSEAYRHFFSTTAGQLVLADLGEYTGWNRVCDPSVDGKVLVDHNARRAVYGRILHFIGLTPDEMRELDQAIRRETIANEEERGTI